MFGVLLRTEGGNELPVELRSDRVRPPRGRPCEHERRDVEVVGDDGNDVPVDGTVLSSLEQAWHLLDPEFATCEADWHLLLEECHQGPHEPAFAIEQRCLCLGGLAVDRPATKGGERQNDECHVRQQTL